MRLAIRRAARGEPTRLPHRIQIHQVAARYGQTPAQVREWPADDFMDALNSAEVTR